MIGFVNTNEYILLTHICLGELMCSLLRQKTVIIDSEYETPQEISTRFVLCFFALVVRYRQILLIFSGLLNNWRWCISFRWHHNELDGTSNHRRLDGLLSRWFRRRTKKTSKLHVTSHYEEISPVTDELPSQRASNAKNISIWWRHQLLDCSSETIMRNMDK